jgi:hypothetical protein
MNCNHQILPISFAFVENENIDNCYWFIESIKVQVVVSYADVCLISDRHFGMLPVICQLQ